MAKTTLSRRTMLRGILGGAGVSLALPLMEAMLDTSGTALADGTSLPRRLGLFYWGNGTILSEWTPTNTGNNWTPKSILQPLELAGVKHKVSVVSGLDMKKDEGSGHHSGRALMLSGSYDPNLGDWGEPTLRTFDQIAADQLQGATPFRSLEIGISRRGFESSQNKSAMAWNDPKSPLPAEHSPAALWERLFSNGVKGSDGPGALVDARRSVLDVVKQDTVALQGKLGATDRIRLEKHLQGIRDLELLLDFDLGSCTVPEMVQDPEDDAGYEQLEIRNLVMSKLLATALACDLTRVFTFKYTGMQTDTYFWPAGAPDGLHTMTHDNSQQGHVRDCIEFMMKELGVLLQELDAIPEGTGTLLDQCGIYCTTDVAEGRTHSTSDMPILLCGSAGGRLRTNYHHRGTGENTSMAPLTVMRACGVDVQGFGEGLAYTESTLSALELY